MIGAAHIARLVARIEVLEEAIRRIHPELLGDLNEGGLEFIGDGSRYRIQPDIRAIAYEIRAQVAEERGDLNDALANTIRSVWRQGDAASEQACRCRNYGRDSSKCPIHNHPITKDTTDFWVNTPDNKAPS